MMQHQSSSHLALLWSPCSVSSDLEVESYTLKHSWHWSEKCCYREELGLGQLSGSYLHNSPFGLRGHATRQRGLTLGIASDRWALWPHEECLTSPSTKTDIGIGAETGTEYGEGVFR